jgi:hypothetical protein
MSPDPVGTSIISDDLDQHAPHAWLELAHQPSVGISFDAVVVIPAVSTFIHVTQDYPR